jgi:hypothetical protein
MSQALASAKKRAVMPPQNTRFPSSGSSNNFNLPPQVPNQMQPSTPATGMNPNAGFTLPQVISIVDKRLLVLEKFMSDSKTNIVANEPSAVNPNMAAVPSNISELLEEYNSRFDIIADELANMKNTIMSLQTFTMEVNKKLFDERVRILSEEPINQNNVELSIEE